VSEKREQHLVRKAKRLNLPSHCLQASRNPSVAEACPFHLPVELWAHALSFVVEENRTVVDGLQVRFD
jgi:hypothetical protein